MVLNSEPLVIVNVASGLPVSLKVIVGGIVVLYPVPGLVTVAEAIAPALTVTVAVAVIPLIPWNS